MDDLQSNIIKAWQDAANDLGIDIRSPFNFQTGDLPELSFPVLVKNFGGIRGTIVLTEYDKDLGEFLVQHEFAFSTLGQSHTQYDRKTFIDMLEDWGFVGPRECRPSWYKHHDF